MGGVLRVAILALLPSVAFGQMLPLVDAPADTIRRGMFFEIGGPGELFSLNYEQRLRHGMVAQVGVTKWSFHFLSPRRGSTAGIATLFRQHTLPDLLSENIAFEFGAGIVAGEHLAEEWPRYTAADSVSTADPPPRIVHKAPWLALTGLVGVRFMDAAKGGMTYRVGLTPMRRIRDLPRELRWTPVGFSLSAGYNW